MQGAALLNPEEETQEAPSDPEMKTQNEERPAAGSMDLGGPIVAASRSTIWGGGDTTIPSPGRL